MSDVQERSPAPLEAFAGAKPPAPDWFTDALAAPHEDRVVEVDGAEIAWRAWGERGKPGLVLVHGGVAHLSWWDFIAPFLARTRRVVALSLSGMGDSGRRESYTFDHYAAETVAVAQAAGLYDAPAKPVLLGHSFGAFVTLMTTAFVGDRYSGAVIVDAPVRPRGERRMSAPRRRGGKTYPTMEEALARFRLLPEQPCENLFIVDHVAREALRDTADGWSWKHDRDVWPKTTPPELDPVDAVAAAKCPFALMRGARSELVTDDVWSTMGEIFGPGAPRASVPEARHHLMLDQPLAFAAAVEGLLSAWPRQDEGV